MDFFSEVFVSIICYLGLFASTNELTELKEDMQEKVLISVSCVMLASIDLV